MFDSIMKNKESFSITNKNIDKLIICRASKSISTELDGETIILNISSGIYSGLDSIGTTIWNLIEKPISFAQLCDQILKDYDVKKEQCIKDLISFLRELAENNLIEVINGTCD